MRLTGRLGVVGAIARTHTRERTIPSVTVLGLALCHLHFQAPFFFPVILNLRIPKNEHLRVRTTLNTGILASIALGKKSMKKYGWLLRNKFVSPSVSCSLPENIHKWYPSG